MAQRAEQPWTTDAFFAWQDRQQDRYELVDGFPIRMMAGARNVHDTITINLLSELRMKLRGSGCVPFSGDSSVETYPGRIRRPDAGIDCGRRDPNAYKAAEPRLVAEVLSPSTRDLDTLEKLAEYKSIASLDTILFVEPNAAQVAVWSRDAERAWERSFVEGLDAVIELPGLGIALPLSELYDGVTFPASPTMRAV
ncbi:Uma2 family endonuclease [Enterovirga rhinocerotis]|uniref:Uma2 family endonuclease n=1 Tax=Enterovirga rhinocerotis TaxID=1339210 RepID=A0A4R7C5T7_9HYPH|nr:Uma2 family endonuclease [Enterovirga rhinocerotis]TDR93443.1 Uma2 family endonuclease [Enterovirga rhinocerotis]